MDTSPGKLSPLEDCAEGVEKPEIETTTQFAIGAMKDNGLVFVAIHYRYGWVLGLDYGNRIERISWPNGWPAPENATGSFLKRKGFRIIKPPKS